MSVVYDLWKLYWKGQKVLIAWDSCILLFFSTKGLGFSLALYSLEGIWSHM